jgi:hypothetical protein
MITMSFFSSNMSETKRVTLESLINLCVASFLAFYILEIIAFGPDRLKKIFFKLYTIAFIYIIVQYIALNVI